MKEEILRASYAHRYATSIICGSDDDTATQDADSSRPTSVSTKKRDHYFISQAAKHTASVDHRADEQIFLAAE